MIQAGRFTLLAAALFGVAASRVSAQGAGDTLSVDRIVAVVGNTPILWSEVSEEVFARVSKGEEHLPDQVKDPLEYAKVFPRVARRYVDTLIAFQLLYKQALTDTTIKVTDQEVNQAVDQTIESARKQFPTEAQYRAGVKEIGFATPDDWRASLVEKQRKVLEVNRYRQQLNDDGKLKPMTPSEKEMRAFYDSDPTMFGNYPASISLRQIIVAPRAQPAERARARALADSLVTVLRAGASFDTLARKFSMDPESRADGGELPWFRRGKMVPEFEAAAFALPIGTISDVVESPYGYHIIQVERIQPGEIKARHILISPEPDSAAQAAAHALASRIRDDLVHGALFDSLQHLYTDPSEEKESQNLPIDAFLADPAGKAYGPGLAGVDSGQFSQPFPLPSFDGDPMRTKWAVVEVTRRSPPGPRSYDDVKEQLRKLLGILLGEQDYISQLRKQTYVDVREP
ncbi:MAG TPA: peptidylprolyl isomerase [Gemmatimonadales bacterium]